MYGTRRLDRNAVLPLPLQSTIAYVQGCDSRRTIYFTLGEPFC